jgi:hypothetical protein
MEFKPISDIPGYEEFTNFVLNIAGELRNVKTGKLRKWISHTNGYLQVGLNQAPAKPKIIRQHRAICCLFKPNPRDLPQVDHINRNRCDNRIDNLQWVSRIEQMHNTGVPIGNTTGEKNIYALFNHGNPVWTVSMQFKSKKRSKTFPRDPSSKEIPQEVINFRNAMRLQIKTELREVARTSLN